MPVESQNVYGVFVDGGLQLKVDQLIVAVALRTIDIDG